MSLLLLLACDVGQVRAAPVVTASIRPLHLIAAAITDGIQQPQLVWAQHQDPHHASLRPSERRSLATADIVLWTGPMLEQALTQLVRELAADLLTVQELPDLHLLTIDGHPDPHVWLDTRNARAIAAALTALLVQLDANNAQRYEANLHGFQMALDMLDATIERQLATFTQQDWAVYHHAFRYFERQFALRPPLVLAGSDNTAPGIRSILALREQLERQQLACMLLEPDVNHSEVRSMLGAAELRLVTADVLGQQLPADGTYVQLLQQLAAAVADCLGGAQ